MGFSVEGNPLQKMMLVEHAIRKYGLDIDRQVASVFKDAINFGRVIDNCIVGADGDRFITAGGRQPTHFVLPADYDKALQAIGKFYRRHA